jgi:hypothetical protein
LTYINTISYYTSMALQPSCGNFVTQNHLYSKSVFKS